MKHILATLVALAVTAGCAVQEPHSVLELPASEGNSRNSEGDFIELRDGRILFAYSKFTDGHGGDHDRCVIASRISSDKGETWTSEDEVLAVNEADPEGNVMSVSMLRLRDGRIALFYLQKIPGDSEKIATRIMMKTSSDEGKNWSSETDCTAGMPLMYRVVNNGRVIRLSSGRILIPVAWHKFHGTGDYDLDSDAELYCLYSDDEGASWKESEGFYIDDEDGSRVSTQEPGVIELKDGSVLMYIRANTGYQWYATSRDGGQTWDEQRHAPYTGPLAPSTMHRLRDGRLLLVWNNHEGRPELTAIGARTPLTLAVSSDEGASWGSVKDLESSYDPDNKMKYFYCYTSVLELKDRLLLSYCAEDGLRHLRITSVPLSWLK